MDTKTDNQDLQDVIDLEAFARESKPVPKAKSYRIRIDKEHYVVHQPSMTGTEILALAGKTPDKYHLYEHFHGGQTKVIQPTDRVDFTGPGVERFTTMKIENTEGK
jgi:hypothetical protein